MIRVWCVSRELFYEVDETIHIVLNCGGLANVEISAEEKLVLIVVEALADHTAEGGPVHSNEIALNGLKPATRRTGKLHSRTLDPHRWVNTINIKIILCTGHPILRIFAIELGKIHFR